MEIHVVELGGDTDHAIQITDFLRRGQFLDISKLSPQICSLPQEQHLVICELACSFFRQPIPAPSTPLNNSSSASDRSDAARSLAALSYLGPANIEQVISLDTSNKIRQLVERTWRQMLQWMQYLLANPLILNSGGLDSVAMTQFVIIYVGSVIHDLSDQAYFKDIVTNDTFVFKIILSAILLQNVEVVNSMEMGPEISDFITLIFSRMVEKRAALQTADGRSALHFLDGHEQEIVRRTLEHLRIVGQPSAFRLSPFRKIWVHMNLLNALTEISSFVPYLVKHRVIIATVAVLKFVTDESNLPPEAEHEFFIVSIISSLYLIVFFYAQPRTDLCIRLTLRERIESALSAISQMNRNVLAPDLHSKSLVITGLILTRFASFTALRNVVMDVQRATTRALSMGPGLAASQPLGDLWLLLRRYANERAVCKYLFDKARRQHGSRCDTCHIRIPHYEMKRCAGCRIAKYCSRQCQKANWIVHKQACNARAIDRKAQAVPGRYDSCFQTALAACDIGRHLPSIYGLIKQSDPSLSLDNIQIVVNYCTSPDYLRPTLMYRRLTEEQVDISKAVFRDKMLAGSDSRARSGALRYVLSELTFPASITNSAHTTHIPINKKWVDLALNPNHALQLHKPRKIAYEMLQRVEFNWLGLNGEEHMQPLEALDDVVDDVLAELEHETEADTTWTYS